jgi:hypothetical protein
MNPALRGKYEQALRDVLERKMSWPGKVFVGGVGVASLAIAIFLGSLALVHQALPPLARIGLAGGAVFALAWVGLVGWTLRRGTWYGKIQPTVIAVLGWSLAVFLETLFLILSPNAKDPYVGTVTILGGMVILISAGVQLILTRIQQSELRTRELMLRLEYRLAEFADEWAKSQRK